MASQLSSEHMAQLVPLLGSLARLMAASSSLNERSLHTLLLGADLDSNPAALDELRRWGRLLWAVQEQPTDEQRQATVEALLLRGLPEASVLLAVATVAASKTGPAQSTSTPAAPTLARLQASVSSLDFGVLRPGQGATQELEIEGGPGQVIIESDQIQVTPTQFGAGSTCLRVELHPLTSGLLWTTLKLMTAGETLEVPVMAQWQDGGTAPAKLLVNPLIQSPPSDATPHSQQSSRQPQPLIQQPPPQQSLRQPQPLIQPLPPQQSLRQPQPFIQQPPPQQSLRQPQPFIQQPPPQVTVVSLLLKGIAFVIFFLLLGLGLGTVLNQNRGTLAVGSPTWVHTMVEVSAGRFLMGSSNANTYAYGDERPQHSLLLPTYWIGMTEVTNAQFRPFVEGDGYRNQAYWDDTGWQWREENKINRPRCWDEPNFNRDNQPVVCVSLYEALAYSRWLSAQTGMDFRLPSEAEWEKAARGTDGRIYPWGDTWEDVRANSNAGGIGITMPVGEYPSGVSPYGAMDMAGNVWEWTRSIYTPYPYNPTDGREDEGNPAQKRFTLRGGAWNDLPIALRTAYRRNLTPDYYNQDVGFRLARHSQQ